MPYDFMNPYLFSVTLCVCLHYRLKQILQLNDISVLGHTVCKLKSEHVRHNMTVLHKNGYVTGISKSELPPSWVISAMRYLAKCKIYDCRLHCLHDEYQ